MADNIILSKGTEDGKTIATDDVGARHFQMIKMSLGADGVDNGTLGKTLALPIADDLAIARGMLTDATAEQIVGRDINLTTTLKEVWDGVAANWVAPTTARTHDIVSSSASDTSAGVGARTVLVEGLSAANNLQSETVTMNGTLNVPTANTYTMIHRLTVLTAGSNNHNVGNITATAQTDATVTCFLYATTNRSMMGIYKIPASTTGYITNWWGSFAALSNGRFRLREMVDGTTIWRSLQEIGLGTGGAFERNFKPAIEIPALSIISVAAVLAAGIQSTSSGFGLVLVT